MNARTIQHPGVQIREIDMSQYTDSIVVNNAYIIGFADRGPIYDYSWVTTRSEFLKLYGEPQTQAEKYLYYAAMSIINNGGTPIISRMPYDNKQCKAYKALAVRYMGVTSPDDYSNPDQVKVYGWGNTPNKTGDFFPDFENDENGIIALKGSNALPLSAEVVIPLTSVADLLGQNDQAWETLYKLNNNLQLPKQDQNIETKDVSAVTIANLLYALNPVSENEITNYLSDIYKNYTGNGKFDHTDYIAATSAFSLMSVHLTGDYEEYEDYSKISGILSTINTDVKNAVTQLKKLTGYAISSYSALSTLNDGVSGQITAHFSKPISPATLTGYLSSNISSFCANVAQFTIHENNYTTIQYNTNTQDINKSNENATNYTSGKTSWEDLSGFCELTTTNKVKSIKLTLSESTEIWDPNYTKEQIFKRMYNKWLSVINTLKDIITNDKSKNLYEEVAVEGLTYYGVQPRTIGISPSAVHNLWEIVYKNLLSGDFKLSSTINEVYNQISTYIDDPTQYDTLTRKVSGLLPLTDIYNSPKFFNLAASENPKDRTGQINQSIVDAKLLSHASIGYSNAIYLDSKEVVISNEQYDDLVTTQKFTNGQNVGDPDAVNDPDFKYRSDIRAANFIIIDKNKTIATGDGSNEGYFVTLIDPYDAMKAQRLLTVPYTESELSNPNTYNPNTEINYWIDENKVEWKKLVNDEVNTVNLIQHVYNADDILIGQSVTSKRHKNLMDSWSTPLTGGYYDDSISRNLGNMYPQIPLADIKPGQKTGLSQIDKIYSSHICVAVCRTLVDPANGKITIAIIQSFFGSLFDEKDQQSGRNLYIGNLINSQSKYIEFYRNDFVKNPYDKDSWQLRIPQIYMKNSAELKEAADKAAIDLSLYDVNDSMNVFVPEEYITTKSGEIAFEFEEFCELYDIATTQGSKLYYAKNDFINFAIKLAACGGISQYPKNGTEMIERAAEFKKHYNDYFKNADVVNYMTDKLVLLPSDFTDNLQLYSYNKLIKDLNYKANIFIFDKTNTVLYNNHPVCYFTSFSRKDAQKVIANTTGLAGEKQGTTSNVAKNFLIDMDRCIKFIKNVDDVSIYFVVDAGLSTIAQFCDNIVWDYFKKKKPFEPVTGGWITQTYDPDHDADLQDREITSIEDVNTWRTVVGKLDEISKEIRKDCMTIIDAPRQLTLDGAAPKIRRSRPTNEWETKIGDKLKYISGINSSYTAGYYNWLRMTDTFSGKSFWLPPTCKVIGNLMYLNIMNLPWLAPAGFNYGVVTGIYGVSHNPGYKEEDQIYLKSWNYIKQYPYDGFVIEGQKTTLTKNSAFNRINVRTLFLDLERFVYNISKGFKYQVNNQYTREQYIQTISPKFSDYQSRGGIYDYKIICDETNNTWETIDRNELRATIYIKPARLIEYILVDFICTKSGANFEELT